jgi:hypothetical protein
VGNPPVAAEQCSGFYFLCYSYLKTIEKSGFGGESMYRKMTITLDETVYEGMHRRIGRRRISKFIEDLVRPYVVDTPLDEGYLAMSADEARENEAAEWCNALAGDMADEAR